MVLFMGCGSLMRSGTSVPLLTQTLWYTSSFWFAVVTLCWCSCGVARSYERDLELRSDKAPAPACRSTLDTRTHASGSGATSLRSVWPGSVCEREEACEPLRLSSREQRPDSLLPHPIQLFGYEQWRS